MISIQYTYKQHMDNSSGPSCVIMAANYLNPGAIDTSENTDVKADKKIYNEIMSTCPEYNIIPAAICRYLLELDRGFEVKYLLHISGAIKNPLIKKCFEEDLKIRDDIIQYSKFHFSEREFDLDTVREEINANKPCLVPLNMGTKSDPDLHWTLILGFYSNQFKYYCTFVDPRDGKIASWTTDIFEKKMDIASGKLFISVWI